MKLEPWQAIFLAERATGKVVPLGRRNNVVRSKYLEGR